MLLKKLSTKFVIVSTLVFTGGCFTMPQTISKAYAAPIEFANDTSAATQWAKKHYGDWRYSLSSNELQTIDYYIRGGGSSAIDKYLIDTHGALIEGRNPELVKNISCMNTALAKHPIPEDVVVYMALPSVNWSDFMLLEDPAMRKALIGSVQGEHFMNTYLLREKVPASHAVLYLTVPKGSKGAVVGIGSSYEEKKELVLDRGYEYKITHIDKEPGTNKWRVYADIVGKWQK